MRREIEGYTEVLNNLAISKGRKLTGVALKGDNNTAYTPTLYGYDFELARTGKHIAPVFLQKLMQLSIPHMTSSDVSRFKSYLEERYPTRDNMIRYAIAFCGGLFSYQVNYLGLVSNKDELVAALSRMYRKKYNTDTFSGELPLRKTAIELDTYNHAMGIFYDFPNEEHEYILGELKDVLVAGVPYSLQTSKNSNIEHAAGVNDILAYIIGNDNYPASFTMETDDIQSALHTESRAVIPDAVCRTTIAPGACNEVCTDYIEVHTGSQRADVIAEKISAYMELLYPSDGDCVSGGLLEHTILFNVHPKGLLSDSLLNNDFTLDNRGEALGEKAIRNTIICATLISRMLRTDSMQVVYNFLHSHSSEKENDGSDDIDNIDRYGANNAGCGVNYMHIQKCLDNSYGGYIKLSQRDLKVLNKQLRIFLGIKGYGTRIDSIDAGRDITCVAFIEFLISQSETTTLSFESFVGAYNTQRNLITNIAMSKFESGYPEQFKQYQQLALGGLSISTVFGGDMHSTYLFVHPHFTGVSTNIIELLHRCGIITNIKSCFWLYGLNAVSGYVSHVTLDNGKVYPIVLKNGIVYNNEAGKPSLICVESLCDDLCAPFRVSYVLGCRKLKNECVRLVALVNDVRDIFRFVAKNCIHLLYSRFTDNLIIKDDTGAIGPRRATAILYSINFTVPMFVTGEDYLTFARGGGGKLYVLKSFNLFEKIRDNYKGLNDPVALFHILSDELLELVENTDIKELMKELVCIDCSD